MIGYADSVRSKRIMTCTKDIFSYLCQQAQGPVAEIEDARERVQRGEMSREDFKEFLSRAKKRLPILTFNATFKGGQRTDKTAQPTGLVMVDLDHIGDSRTFYSSTVEPRIKKLGVVLAHVTPSGEGLRVVVKASAYVKTSRYKKGDKQMLIDVQEAVSKQLGVKWDRACKDWARSSFAVPEDYILYINEEVLFGPAEQCASALRPSGATMDEPSVSAAAHRSERPTSRDEACLGSGRGASETVAQGTGDDAANCRAGAEAGLVSTSRPDGAMCSRTSDQSPNVGLADRDADAHKASSDEPRFKGVPYSAILQKLVSLKGGEPEQGERNAKLFAVALELRYICDNDEELMARIIPNWGLSDEEKAQTIHSACRDTYLHNMPRDISEAVKWATRASATGVFDDDDDSSTPPSMPNTLPPLIDLLTSTTPDIYKPAVAHAVFPSLAAHLWRVRFPYIDGVEHEATLMNVLMAGTGAGKSCITAPIAAIMEDIRQRDEENMKRERAWKDENNGRGANKDKAKRPEGLIIQEVDPDMTNPAFVMRMAEAQEHFLYTQMNEIDQFDALRGSGRGGQQFQIMCLAFDPGNRYGQTRVGMQSVTEKVCIRFNWNASTTIGKGKKYFSRVLTDGPISRINFCTIPEREIGADMPIYGKVDDVFRARLKPYIDNLTAANGLIDCREASALIIKMKDKAADFARMSQNRTFENLSFRALVIAYLKACVLYVANGQQWDEAFNEFIEWSFDYDMWCKMAFFSEDIIKAEAGAAAVGYKPHNLLSELPDTFTWDDVAKVRAKSGMSVAHKSIKSMISVWIVRKYIKRNKDKTFTKSNS